MLTNNQRVKEEIKREREKKKKNNLEANKNENTVDQMYVMLYKQFQEGSL